MNRTTKRHRPPILIICLLAFLALSWSVESSAAIRVVENVETSGNRITFTFSIPMQYLSHVPGQQGKVLQVELRSLAGIDDLNEFTRHLNLSWRKSPEVPLLEITYEGDDAGKVRLYLRFKQTVNFDMVRNPGPYTLDIDISPVVASKSEDLNGQGQQDTESKADVVNRYAINLRSSLEPLNTESISIPEDLKQLHLYTTEFRQNGTTWHRLRLGFFSTEQEARDAYDMLKKDFPEAWITKAPISDHEASTSTVGTGVQSKQSGEPDHGQLPSAGATAPQFGASSEPLAEQEEQQLLTEAEKAMVANDYRRAVQLYTKLSRATNPATRQKAQELLGLARERNGQMAHAKAEYEKYLDLYPQSEGAERVKQRLAGLLTARATPKSRLRKAKGEEAPDNDWETDIYGSFSQFYNRDVTYTQADETIVNRSAVSSDLDFNARARNDDYDLRATFIGGLENDFLDNSNGELRINSLYVDALARDLNLSTRIGRQTRSSGGVLGRFDGGLLRWRMNDSTAVNLVSGFPVVSSTDTDLNSGRHFYGISLDLGPYAKKWNFNTFFISQSVDGIIDRQAIGGEVRYFSQALSFFSLIDYDISYKELNTALMTANYTLPSKTSFSLTVDYRKSPVLTTSNALIGQTATSIDNLLKTFDESDLRQLARDRTATSRSYTLGITHPFNEHLQINSDLTVSEVSGTPASGGVEAQPGTGLEYYYSLQLVGSSLIKDGDIAILGLRYADTKRSRTYSASVNTRYPVSREFRINPRLLIDYRVNKDDDGCQLKIRPLVRLEYTWEKRYHLEIEGGGEWSSERLAGDDNNTTGYFVTVGYRIDF